MRAACRSFCGVYKPRNEALIVRGIKAGFGISELLSRWIKLVWQYGKIVERVQVPRRHMKGGKADKATCYVLRKTFAMRVHAYDHSDWLKTQKPLGHVNINTSIKYLALDETAVDGGILAARRKPCIAEILAIDDAADHLKLAPNTVRA